MEWGKRLLLLLVMDVLSIVVVTWFSTRHPFFRKFGGYFMGESSRPLPLLTSFMAFMFFKKMRLPYIPLINNIGGSTFGVLLIHANSDTMRRWLWKDFLRNVGMYSSPWLVVHAIGSVLAIFFVCVVIHRLRILFIEPPLLVLFDRNWPSVVRRFNGFENWFIRKTVYFTGK